ncbi:triple tyrosine motif-containing protein [Marivirga harenae]|uniref:triple tyrosine motif-containing protein n=1 Tax=Marivirga harenae TaxID=2010992 RepID=UPI0026DF364C|nr:triple tyrosine motif-containing protein [Marivirga harenae]WKV10656.1 triple tyrosine motif-containing protein [Marivirga harenae]|tara:strand:- start:36557 stop:39352 length:2796 start_codon:yes stop_codon:yes gene_type:complete
MQKLYLFLFITFNSLLLIAQDGDVPLNHFNVPIPPQDFQFNDLKIDEQGRLLVAYKKGILQFDGNSWLKIDITSSPLKFLQIANRTFLLAKDGIYEKQDDYFHQTKFIQVFSIPITSNVVDLIQQNSKYYLLVNEEIISFDQDFKKLKIYESQLGYKDIFTFENKLYAFEGNYLLENVDGTWIDLNLFAPESTDFLFSLKGLKKLYFAYDNGDFYSFDGKEFDPYSSELNEYLKENYPLAGKFLDEKLIISTLSGGVVLVNEKSGKIISTIQSYNGLPTNEVNAITMDFQNGLWLAHPYGLTRASLDIPFSDFQFYPGLGGLPEVTLFRNDTLWVGTTEGLFYLKEVKDYETLQKKLVEKVRISVPNQPRAEEEDADGFLEGLFSFDDDSKEEEFLKEELKKFRSKYRDEGIRFKALREKLDEKEQQLKDSIQYANKNTKKISNKGEKIARSQYRSVVKTIDVSRLKSIKFEYQKINNVKEHVESLVDTEFGLIARSNTGISLIRSETSEQISNLKMVKKLLYEPEKSRLWLSNGLGLFSIDLSTNEFKVTQHSDNRFNDIIIQGDQLFALGNNFLEIFTIENDKITTSKQLDITNNFSEEMLIYQQESEIKLLKSDGIFTLNSNELEIDSSFSKPVKYFLKDQENNIWVLSAKDEWGILNKKLSDQLKKWLHIIPPLKSINKISDSTIFFTSNKRVVRWNPSSITEYPFPNTFIDGVMIENKWVESDDFVKLNHKENNLKVILSTPEYLFIEDVEYQYFVKGLMDEWSSWSKSREIDFPYIPTGDYKLEIKARTILNNEVSQFNFEFEVLPPYWQTWWFYSLEIAFFSILILISIRLNTTNQSSYLTKTFTFLTLILFLEFLATILENNLEGYIEDSPVYTFVINVVLALSITPIERGISKLLVVFNSSRSKQLIIEMRKNQKNKKNEQN